MTTSQAPRRRSRGPVPRVPDKPSLDGLEDTWVSRWEELGINRFDAALPYEPSLQLPQTPDPAQPVPISRRAFIDLCAKLTAADEKVFEDVWRRLGLSVDWSFTYATIDDASRAAAQRAFLRNLARGEAYLAQAPSLWDVTFGTAVAQAELEDRDWRGGWHRIVFRGADGLPIPVETTRPELLPACVALVAHPDD